MTESKKVLYLLAAVVSIFFLPYAGASIVNGGIFPDNFFAFPALEAPAKSPFNIVIFVVTALIFSFVLLIYLFPGIIGFKKSPVTADKSLTNVPLPIWFWIGLAVWGATLVVLWGKFSTPRWLINWAALPLYWGFTLMIDGWVYVRTEGKSLVSKSIQELIGIGTASISGWLLFEYLNFFVDDNWIYPAGNLIDDDEFVIYAVLGSSGLMPMCFELYYLLKTSRFFGHRFDNGPIVRLKSWVGTLLLAACFGSLFLVGFFPDLLFGCIWVSPLCILFVVMTKLNYWTPFTPIASGNWTPALLFNITYLILGLLVECWNYFSAYHTLDNKLVTHNPDYWSYSVPYVNVLHVFEMPLLGFLGYLPFGLYCAVWWLFFCYLLNIPTKLPKTELAG